MHEHDDDPVVVGARRNRSLDRDLAPRIGRPDPNAAEVGPDYLGRLAGREALAPGGEAAMVREAQAGDAQARAALVEAFLPLIGSAARTYRAGGAVQRVELLQEGVVGLLRALERYDPGRGVPFWAYASWWVRQAMQQLVAELTYPSVLSDRALRHLARLKEAHRAALVATGREPGRDELVERSGLSGDQVDDLLAVQHPARSLDEPTGGDDGAVGTFGELLVDPLAEDAYEGVLEASGAPELVALLSGLSDRERRVLTERYGLAGEPRSLRDVGAELGVSAERVRQLERRALGKLAAAAGVAGQAS